MSVEILGYKAVNKSTLQGYLNIYVPKMGLEIYGLSVHMKNGHRWVNMPSRQYEDQETGETKYLSIVRFREKSHYDRFQDVVLRALDKYFTKS